MLAFYSVRIYNNLVMGHIDHKIQSPTKVNFAVVTVSDSRTEDTDESGQYLCNCLKDNGHRLFFYRLLKNEGAEIAQIIKQLPADVQIVIFSGGTGLSHRDITVETVTPLLDKVVPGFGELFRLLTWEEIGTPSIMSRAVGGAIQGKIILCLPGSLNAVKLATERIILPEMGHMVREAAR